MGKRTFEVLLIPGHTPGSIALFDREHKLLISGDSVQTGTVYLFGPGRNLPAYLCSLKRLVLLQGEIEKILPSHGDLPVSPDTINKLVKADAGLLAGNYEGHAPKRQLNCLEYDCGIAKFLY